MMKNLKAVARGASQKPYSPSPVQDHKDKWFRRPAVPFAGARRRTGWSRLRWRRKARDWQNLDWFGVCDGARSARQYAVRVQRGPTTSHTFESVQQPTIRERPELAKLHAYASDSIFLNSKNIGIGSFPQPAS